MQAHTHTTHTQRERETDLYTWHAWLTCGQTYVHTYTTRRHMKHTAFMHPRIPFQSPTQSIVARHVTHTQWNVPVHGTLTTLHGTHGSVKVGAPAVIVVVCGSLPQLSEEGSYDKEVRWCGMVRAAALTSSCHTTYLLCLLISVFIDLPCDPAPFTCTRGTIPLAHVSTGGLDGS